MGRTACQGPVRRQYALCVVIVPVVRVVLLKSWCPLGQIEANLHNKHDFDRVLLQMTPFSQSPCFVYVPATEWYVSCETFGNGVTEIRLPKSQ
ncbi:hypothetical protein GGS20DRAFT_563386 [Poronia punctata]|nr:hypothetical protein GGS20DRAFT_563386 [Poronia punctata]